MPSNESLCSQPESRLDAVIFDMDGVVTDTAKAHAAAWKRVFDEYLQERAARSGESYKSFDIDSDYRLFVDGKPRFDGVASFLGSRGIELPFGEPNDRPECETVCGLGNRKNRHFHAWLEVHRVHTYPSTIRLLRALRLAGVKTGVFTSSRNGSAVLANAGISELFDAQVDGMDLVRLNIPGKPHPAMLLETVARLSVLPERAAVVEDAISGVAAGSAGHFSLVIGVDRDGHGPDLVSHGADLIVRDLAELEFGKDRRFRLKTLRNLPRVWECEQALRTRLRDKELAVFLDYDGTLTPIVEDFTQAFLSEEMRAAVAALAARCTVGILSGRDLPYLKQLVGLAGVIYAGSHGFDIEAPGEQGSAPAIGEAFLPELNEAECELSESVRDIKGCALERKRFAIAVHYRRVTKDDVARVEALVDAVIEHHPRLRKGGGKKVFEIEPRVDWHKGRAIEWLLERLSLSHKDVFPIYVGDDLTDEDAFQALAGRGLAIAVGDEDRPTASDLRVASPDGVRRLLAFFSSIIDENG